MSGVNIGPEELENAVSGILEKYMDDINDIVETAVKDVGKAAAAELKKTSPVRTGDYAKGWKAQKLKTRYGVTTVCVHNPTCYRLTHLLEHGHALRNGGRSKAYPHIKPAEEKAADNLGEKIRIEVGKIK